MIGILGGSFDPPHFGHIKSVLGLLERYSFEQIRLIPALQSPHKEHVYAKANHRWHMVNLVSNSYEKLVADDRELKREAPSYTMDTLLELRREYGSKQSLALILGIDAFMSFCKWHRYEEILSLCHIILMQRPGYSLSEGLKNLSCEREIFESNRTQDINILMSSPCGNIYSSDLKKIDVSSTAIRKMISEDQQPKYMLPGNIWNYIRRNSLYK